MFAPTTQASVAVDGTDARFPVHRIYCVARNYREHAKEMGYSGREAPFFFQKPSTALVAVESGEVGTVAYPSLTASLHHEVELVAAIRVGGTEITAADAKAHVFGYAVGLDMTRRDLQADMKERGRPWEIGKAFEQSAPVGPIVPTADICDIERAEISLSVNGARRQQGNIGEQIWNVAEIIEHLSNAWELRPGDLIFTGTPQGVAEVIRGDEMSARITGLPSLIVRVE